jgi:ferredoxin/flavodoxin---NADP+ reductase
VPTTDRATGQTTYPQPPGVVEILSARQFQIDQPSVKLKGTIHFEEYW